MIDAGSCEEEEEEEEEGSTEARWGFSEEDRSCTPFYWSGCGGNQNSFVTRDECRSTCPNAFPPELEVITKILNIEEGGEALLRVNVSGNPSPDVTWRHGEEDVGWDDRVEKMSDHSVRIVSVVAEDAGTWTITVNNGLGQVVRRQVGGRTREGLDHPAGQPDGLPQLHPHHRDCARGQDRVQGGRGDHHELPGGPPLSCMQLHRLRATRCRWSGGSRTTRNCRGLRGSW